MDLELDGQCAIVTGASKGIGFATALELVREGVDVAICGRGATALEQAREALLVHDRRVHGRRFRFRRRLRGTSRIRRRFRRRSFRRRRPASTRHHVN